MSASVEAMMAPVQSGRQRWVDVGALEAIPPGEGRAFVAGDRAIAVFRQRDGSVYASDNRCPHRGGPLADGIVGGATVICPLHAWTFDLETGRCAEGATVRVYRAVLAGGRVHVLLEEVDETS